MIVEHIGVPALLEQLAEECCELAQASLKMARKLRDENPTPKSVEDIRDNLVEEIADVELCIELTAVDALYIPLKEIERIKFAKHERWLLRLEPNVGFDFEEIYKDIEEI